jgi:hypothetical protein
MINNDLQLTLLGASVIIITGIMLYLLIKDILIDDDRNRNNNNLKHLNNADSYALGTEKSNI